MEMFKKKYAAYWIAAVVMFVTLLVYLPALTNNFVKLDDHDYVVENEHIRSLGLDFFRWAFTSFHASNYHPLTWVSHAMDYALWGLNPLGHHLSSIIFHGLNSFLVVLLTVMLLNVNRRRSLRSNDLKVSSDGSGLLIAGAMTGLLFGLHPVHVESVAWIAERKDVLSAFFFLLSCMAYLEYASAERQTKKSAPYFLCLLFFILALLSKPMAVTLPVVLLVLDVYPLNRLKPNRAFTSDRKVIIEKIPFLILSAASSMITLMAQTKAIATLEGVPLKIRLMTSVRSLFFYLYKMLWPDDLEILVVYSKSASFNTIEYGGPLLFVLGVTAFCLWFWKKQKIFLATWTYYVVTLLPVLGIVQVGVQSSADRYTYLPSLGPFILIGVSAAFIWRKAASAEKTFLKSISMVPFVLAVVVLSYMTMQQIGVWHDNDSLWENKINTGKAKKANQFLAQSKMYLKSGDYAKALMLCNEALKIDQYLLNGYFTRGEIYLSTGNYQYAIADYNTAISFSSDSSDKKLLNDKRKIAYAMAIKDATKAIEAKPDYADAYFNRGLTYELQEDYPKAVKDFDKTIILTPRDGEAFFHRATVYLKLGDDEKAARDFQTAARLGNRKAQKQLQSWGIGW